MKRGDRIEWDIGEGKPWKRTETGVITGMEGKNGPRIYWDGDPPRWSSNVCDWSRLMAEGKLRVIPR